MTTAPRDRCGEGPCSRCDHCTGCVDCRRTCSDAGVKCRGIICTQRQGAVVGGDIRIDVDGSSRPQGQGGASTGHINRISDRDVLVGLQGNNCAVLLESDDRTRPDGYVRCIGGIVNTVGTGISGLES